MSENKQNIISEIYYDRSGYGSKKTTLEDSKKKTSQLQWLMLMNSFIKMLMKKENPEAKIHLLHLMLTINIKQTYFLLKI